jgi:hypothetical protein
VPVAVPRGNALGIQAASDRVYLSGTLILHIFAAGDGKLLVTAP